MLPGRQAPRRHERRRKRAGWWSFSDRSDTLLKMDRWHEGWWGSWWVAAAGLFVACGGRSGELYYDTVSTGNGSFGTGGGGDGGTGGVSVNGGAGGSGGSDNFGGSGGAGGTPGTGGDGGSFAFGGSNSFGGSLPFGGMGGAGGSDNTGGSDSTGGMGGAGGSDNTGGSGGAGGTNNGGGGNMGGSSGAGGSSTTSGPLECLGCIAQSCPFLVECPQDRTCFERLLCTIDECFQGEPGIECLIQCHDGDVVAALELAEALTCAVQTCGDRCNFEQ